MKILLISALIMILAPAHDAVKKTEKHISLQNEELVNVRIEFGAGHLYILPTDEPVVYSGKFIYDKLEPIIKYDRSGNKGKLEFELDEQREDKHDTFDDVRKNEWNLSFSRKIAYEFDIRMGAAESEFNFGGLKIQNLRLECGASKTYIDFPEPNPEVMDKLKIDTGVSKFGAANLLNANFRELRFKGGIGDYQLKFNGELKQSVDAFIDISLGALTIYIPENIPFRVDCDRSILSSLDVEGAFQKDERWYSRNYNSQDPFVDFNIHAGVGSISILQEPD